MGGPPPLPPVPPPSWLGEPLLRSGGGAPAVIPEASPAPPAPVAPPQFNLSNKQYDGHLIGGGGDYPPDTPLSQIRGVLPSHGEPSHKILFVNGIANSVDDHYKSLQAIADRAGAEVVGVYNATEGGGKDLLQCLGDKLDIGKNAAVDTLAGTLYAELSSSGNAPINIMAHSQGGLITSRALEDVKQHLMDDGLSRAEAEARLSRINVETFGAAAWNYTDGPRYGHHVNALDPVSTLFGQGFNPLNPLGLFTHGGAGAERDTFVSTQGNLHGFNEVYLPQWETPFPKDGPK